MKWKEFKNKIITYTTNNGCGSFKLLEAIKLDGLIILLGETIKKKKKVYYNPNKFEKWKVTNEVKPKEVKENVGKKE